jgi:hypothetical protein
MSAQLHVGFTIGWMLESIDGLTSDLLISSMRHPFFSPFEEMPGKDLSRRRESFMQIRVRRKARAFFSILEI